MPWILIGGGVHPAKEVLPEVQVAHGLAADQEMPHHAVHLRLDLALGLLPVRRAEPRVEAQYFAKAWNVGSQRTG